MKRTIQSVLFCLATLAAHAQTPPAGQTGIEKGTFGMAKATVEFLATDQKTFPTARKVTCDSCTTYADLISFAKGNALKGADGLVNDIKKHSLSLNDDFAADAFSSEGAVLDSLRRYVLGRVTSGTERVHRAKLASFPAYETRMVALAGGADPEQAVEEQNAAQQEGDAPAANTPDVNEPEVATAGLSLGTWAFWLSLLNLAGLVALWFNRGRGGNLAGLDKLDNKVAGLQDENTRLAQTVADLTNRLTLTEKKPTGSTPAAATPVDRGPADRSPAGPANRPNERNPNERNLAERGPAAQSLPVVEPLTDRGITDRGQGDPNRRSMGPGQSQTNQPVNQPRPGYDNPANPVIPPQNAPTTTPVGNTTPTNVRPTPSVPQSPANTSPAATDRSGGNEPANRPPAAATPPPPTRLFARTADLGNGFSVAGLLSQPERGTVYELELTSPSTAVFRVSMAPEAQQLAMSDPYSYLSDACLYENQPVGSGGRIQTIAPGQLTLQSDKWQIVEKARIGFV